MRNLTDNEEQVRLVARFLMDEYALNDWNLTFRKMTRTLGQCSHRKKRIQLSTYFISCKPLNRILNTILHEIAHALLPYEAGHGKTWRAMAERIGAIPRARLTDQQFSERQGE